MPSARRYSGDRLGASTLGEQDAAQIRVCGPAVRLQLEAAPEFALALVVPLNLPQGRSEIDVRRREVGLKLHGSAQMFNRRFGIVQCEERRGDVVVR